MTSKKTSTSSHNNSLSTKKKGRSGNGSCRKCKISGGGGDNGGGRGNNHEQVFKKGPWTVEEDVLLIEYVKKHGERHWNCVQKTGLMRCGKSCRLRWTNHLRPDLKKGAFTVEEERMVLELHATLGNKWSKIAAQLPGRTDNEVKNFWNTKIKRRMRANLPLHSSNSGQYHQYSFEQTLIPRHCSSSPLTLPNPIFSSSPLLSPAFTTTPSPLNFTANLSVPIPNLMSSSQAHDPIMSFLNNPAYKSKFWPDHDDGYVSHGVPLAFSLPESDLHYPLTQFPIETASSGTHLTREMVNIVDLPLTRTAVPVTQPVTPTSGDDRLWLSDGSSITEEGRCVVVQPVADGSRDGRSSSHRKIGSSVVTREVVADKSQFMSHNRSSQLSIETKAGKEPPQEMVALDDDLSSLLHDFSGDAPPEWYYTTMSAGGDSPMMTLDNHHTEASASSATTTVATEVDWTHLISGAFSKRNMPGVL